MGTSVACWACTSDAAPGVDSSVSADALNSADALGLADAALADAPNASCEITCLLPDPGKVTICGQLIDGGTNTRIQGPSESGTWCTAVTSDDGPCSIELRVIDAISFAGSPAGAAALAYDQLRVNECGRFMIHNVPWPSIGALALVADDHPSSGSDTFAFTASFLAVQSGERVTDRRTYVVKTSTDAMWTGSAGAPFGGTTFGERGVFCPIFMGPSTTTPGQLVPYPNVQITRDSSVQSSDDYYFSDTDPNLRTTINPSQSVTGTNGAGLLVNSSLTNHSGFGAEPTGCQWPTVLAASLEGVILASDWMAENITTGEECM